MSRSTGRNSGSRLIGFGIIPRKTGYAPKSSRFHQQPHLLKEDELITLQLTL